MKKGSCFEKWGIALESTAKFKGEIHEGTDIGLDAKAVAQENLVRAMGWHDEYKNATFAFGKLYAADAVIMHFTELELWCFSRVYDFDSFECEFCEWTNVWKRPPDFVTLQSNILYEMKNAAKFIVRYAVEGEEYICRKWIAPTAHPPLEGTVVRVFYRAEKPNKAKVEI
jgi:hypothetical protein